MSTVHWIFLGVFVVLLIIAGLIVFMRLRRKKLYQMFEHIFESAKQVPKQKKHNFILFMFKESLYYAKNRKVNPESRMNNQRLVETQMIQMGSILKDRTKVTDKTMKQALSMYDAYLKWEKLKVS